MSTIFAPITSQFRSGVLLIRISGSKTLDCLRKIGLKGEAQHQKISLQKIINPENGEIIDEALISFFKAPNSFTGEDVAEISIHASPFILKKITQIFLKEENCRLAEAGEFSKRAFLNGKIDLVQAEAIPDLIASETEIQHRQAIRQLDGKLSKIYEDWRSKIIEISALIEAAIDFPDDDLPENIIKNAEKSVQNLIQEIESHINDQRIGQKIKDGLRLVIIGAPNVGKSSLLNFLAKSDVAIVSEIAGTTRDVVETHLEIAGVPVIISDTAGIRETDDKIEAEGIRRALEKSKQADIRIVMIDSENKNFDQNLIEENSILVMNKSDLILDKNFLESGNFLKISLSKRQNLDSLLKKLEEAVIKLVPNINFPAITQERYRVSLNSCLENLKRFSLQKNIELAAEDLRMASRDFGKITGKIDVENILDVVFSSFCIGK